MSKHGSNQVQVTPEQQAQEEEAVRQWQLYDTQLKPYETMFMSQVDELNAPHTTQQLADTGALGSEMGFEHDRDQLTDHLAAAGIDPTSGRYQAGLKDLETGQALAQADTVNRAQSSGQDRYVAGLQDVMALGRGQRADSLGAYDNLAEQSVSRAGANAQAALAEKQAEEGLGGSLLGAYAAYQLHQRPPASDSQSYLDETRTLDDNRRTNPFAHTYFGGR